MRWYTNPLKPDHPTRQRNMEHAQLRRKEAKQSKRARRRKIARQSRRNNRRETSR